jgi:hypothetical protein
MLRRMSRLGSSLHAILIVVLLFLMLACGSPPPPADVEPIAGPGAIAAPAGFEPGESPFDASAVEHLPADTEVVLMAKNPRALLERLRYPELRERYAALFEEAAAESIRELAEDFTSVAALETIGLDLNAPAGFAWLNSEAEAGCLFGGLRDPEAFRRWVRRAAVLQRTELTESQQGDAVVLRPAEQEDVALIVHPDRFTFVFVDRQRYAAGIIGRLVRITPDDSLASAPAFQRLSGYRLAATELAAYVGVQSALSHLFEQMRGQHVPIASDIHAAVLGVSIGSGRTLEIDAVLDLKSGSLLRAAMVEGPAPHIFRSQIDGPALVVGGHVAHERIGAAFDEILRSERDPERERRQIEEALGLDLHRQIAKALTGELGLSVRTDTASPDVWSRERVTISAGLEDDGGQALVDQLTRVVGESDKPTVERQGGYLVVSDDAKTLASLRRPEPQGRLPKGIDYEGFFAPGAAAWLRLDAMLVASEVFHVRSPGSVSVATPPPPPDPVKNPRVQALVREIDEVQRQIDERVDRAEAIQDEPARGVARRAGSTLLRFSLEGDAVRVRGVQALDAPSLAALLEHALTDLSETGAREKPLEAEVQALLKKRAELEQKLEEARAKQLP